MRRIGGTIKKNHFFILFLAIIVVSFLFFISFKNKNTFAADDTDTTPPKIYSIEATQVTATSSTITWKTDKKADSLVNYGLDSNYGIVREPFFDKTEHKISIENLLPGNTYYFRVTSADSKGNQGISSDFTFVTPKITEETGSKGTDAGKGLGGTDDGKGLNGSDSGKGLGGTDDGKGWTGNQDGNKGWEKEGVNELTEIVQKIQTITNPNILEKIQEQIQSQAEIIDQPPIITIDLAEVEVGTDYAIIKWKTDRPANDMVSLVSDAGYDSAKANPYSWSEGHPNDFSLEHSIRVEGLQPATIYHYQASSKSELGLIGKSNDGVFRTDSVNPEIINLRIGKIEEHAVTLLWTTNVPCSEIVEYTNLVNNRPKIEGNSSLFTFHSLQINNLEFDTPYRATVKVENEFGKKTESNPIFFTTTKDEIPPVISKVATESTLYPGADNKVQTIISWMTDESAICELSYQRGLGNEKPEVLPAEQDYVLKHVNVGVNFLPATVYKFVIKCQDQIGNSMTSKDYTMLTPSQEKSILDIIIGNFESSFGWLKKVKN